MQLARLISFSQIGHLPNWAGTQFGQAGNFIFPKRPGARPVSPALHMAKRGRANGSLTGGTGDVNPQLYRLSVTTPATSSTTTFTTAFGSASFPVPVPKFSQQQGRAIVMEILKIRWNTQVSFNFNDSSTRLMTINATLTTKQWSSNPPSNDGSVIDYNGGTVECSPGTTTLVSFRYDRYPSTSLQRCLPRN